MSKAPGKISSLGTLKTFLKVGTCSETMCNVIDRAFNQPMELEENAALPFTGGIMQQGYQCGLIWGAVLAAGAQAYRIHGPGAQAEAAAVITAQKLVESFHDRFREINCLELTDTDWKKTTQIVRYFIKGGTLRCLSMAAKYPPIAVNEINASLSEMKFDGPSPPVSCAALLARKMGASELQAVMAAGLAGGIGLCGGGCGVLGTAIWVMGLNKGDDYRRKMDFDDPELSAVIDRFLEASDYEFECADIVGRKFSSVNDHACHVRQGGCSDIIEALAAHCAAD